jgi:hypothetical protein
VEALDGALDWIGKHRRIWDERFDKLDALLADIQGAPRGSAKTKSGTRVKKSTTGRNGRKGRRGEVNG